MQRVFTKDMGDRYKARDVRDYPIGTWHGIADSFAEDLDQFSKPYADAVVDGAESSGSTDFSQLEAAVAIMQRDMAEMRTEIDTLKAAQARPKRRGRPPKKQEKTGHVEDAT